MISSIVDGGWNGVHAVASVGCKCIVVGDKVAREEQNRPATALAKPVQSDCVSFCSTAECHTAVNAAPVGGMDPMPGPLHAIIVN